ncbi:MAG: DUF2252 family protein [Nannocystaceae bacterium]
MNDRAQRPAIALALASLATLAAVACDPDPDYARGQWLHNTIVLDNQVFFEGAPELAPGKMAKMALDLYAYFRGTAGCYARDLAQAGGPGYLPTAFLSEDAADVALVGDPHLENIGTYRRGRDGLLVVDFNDFDAATYGPYHFDVRRLALSAAIASAAIDAVDPGFAEATAGAPEALVHGYVDEIAALAEAVAAGGAIAPLTEEDAPFGRILADLVTKAKENGGDREELGEYTQIEGGARTIRLGEVEPSVEWGAGPFSQVVYADALVAVDDDDIWLIDQVLFESYPASVADPALLGDDLAALQVKGAARRLGAGVASYPVRRYYVLVEGPTEEIADDWILELKQVFDPLVVPGLEQAAGARPYADNGARVVAMQRGLHGAADNDPLLGHGHAGGLTFRVRERTKYQRGLGVDRIAEKSAEGKWSAADYLELATWAGRLLARAHARAAKRDGAPGLPAIAAALAEGEGGSASFVAETVAFVDAYAPVVEADALRFGGLLERFGPSLGYVRR